MLHTNSGFVFTTRVGQGTMKTSQMSKAEKRYKAEITRRIRQITDDPGKLRQLLEVCGDRQHVVMYAIRNAVEYGGLYVQPWAVVVALLEVVEKLLQKNADLGAAQVLQAKSGYVAAKQAYSASIMVTKEFLHSVEPSAVEDAILDQLDGLCQSLCQQIREIKRKEQEACGEH